MRTTTAFVLATLGMVLTSTAVWSATAPAPGPDRASDPTQTSAREPEREREPERPDQPPEIVDKSSFVAGRTLLMEGRLGHAKLLADARGETFLFVDVRSDDAAIEGLGEGFGATSFEPLNLAIVIDRSGSMKGQRERNALDAAAGMIRRLRDGDTVSILAYADAAHTVVPVTTVSSATRERIVRDLQLGLADQPHGHTCISCGLEAGMRSLAGRRAGIDRVLLLSDGEANRGIQDEPGIRTLARQARVSGATISSIGVDVDYNERLMSAIAREANGRHYFADTGEDLEQIFDQELDSLITAIAKDAKLEVELAPGVRVAEVLDRSYQQVDRRVIVPMGTFAKGERKTLLLRLELPPSPVGQRPVAALSFRYDDLLGTPDGGECFGELAVQMTATPTEVSALDALVLGRLSKSETSRTLEQANALFASGRTSEAQRLVDQHLETLGDRKQQASVLRGAGGLTEPVGRSLDDDFAAQADVLEQANAGFEAAAAAPVPAPTSRPGKAQVRRNAEKADAFAL
jgi:Ca-activated chloride channel homolog